MPKELYYIRAKEIFENDNILMVISYLEFRKKNNDEQVIAIRTGKSHSEEYNLTNLPDEIKELEEIKIKLSSEEFDQIKDLYENNVREFIRYNS